MAQEQKIQFKVGTCFELPKEELKNFYIYFALSQFRFLRSPDYQEKVLLKRLSIEIKQLLGGTQELMKQMPNNHALHKILAFFDNHSKQLSMIKDEFTEQV